jgi:hypothetical protein
LAHPISRNIVVKTIKPLKKNEKGVVNNTGLGLADNDVDAFRHAYLSGAKV